MDAGTPGAALTLAPGPAREALDPVEVVLYLESVAFSPTDGIRFWRVRPLLGRLLVSGGIVWLVVVLVLASFKRKRYRSSVFLYRSC